MFDDKITLRGLAADRDEYGVMQTVPTDTTIFCDVSSVSASEFFDAGQSGIHAEFRFTVWADEYSGQQDVVYRNKPYRVYRTYKPDVDHIELYVEERVGV